MKWISVEEKVPEIQGSQTLCSFLTHCGTQQHTAILKYQSGHFWGGDSCTRDVTHWMPLPNPPLSDTEEPYHDAGVEEERKS